MLKKCENPRGGSKITCLHKLFGSITFHLGIGYSWILIRP